MRVDFYQLSRDPIEAVVPLLAAKAIEGGGRLVVVSADPDQRAALSEGLWNRENAFLAHGNAGESHAARQPVLLAESCDAANRAPLVLIADGLWRAEAASFERAILLFEADQTGEARELWTELSGEGHALRIFKQRDGGGWREGR